MLRNFVAGRFSALFSALLLVSSVGCGGVPEEATGEPVPENYEDEQHAAQQKAMEEAMKNRGRR